MVFIIIKKTERDLRERAAETPHARRFKGVQHYARDVEEADNLYRSRGRDNPANTPVLCDDGGVAEKKLRDRTLRAAGKNPEAYS